MSKIIKGNDEIIELGRFFYFIILSNSEDITASHDLQGINSSLQYEIITVNKDTKEIWYIGPFGSREDAFLTQKTLNSRANQIRTYSKKGKTPPELWRFIAEREW